MNSIIKPVRVKWVLGILDDPDKKLVRLSNRAQVLVHSSTELKENDIVLFLPSDHIYNGPTLDQYVNFGNAVFDPNRRARLVAFRYKGHVINGAICTDPYLVHEEQLDSFFGVAEPPPNCRDNLGCVMNNSITTFYQYSKVPHLLLTTDAWTEGLPVRITEKLHGDHFRFGVLKDAHGEWQFVTGERVFIATDDFYADQLDEPAMKLLNHICDGEREVIVFSEIIGPGTSTGDNYSQKKDTYRVFDIMVDGEFIEWDLVKAHCEACGVKTVPTVYEGPFSWCLVEGLTDKGSVVGHPSQRNNGFVHREGIVVTPLQETKSEVLGQRLIGQSINCDFETHSSNKVYGR